MKAWSGAEFLMETGRKKKKRMIGGGMSWIGQVIMKLHLEMEAWGVALDQVVGCGFDPKPSYQKIVKK